MRLYKIEKKVVETYLVPALSQDDAEFKVARGEAGDPVDTRTSADLVEPSRELECSECVNGRPNGVCELTLCTHEEVCDQFEMREGDGRCECGWWSCGSRGCGDCPDCCGEYCECGF
jgi:hypothetical protein